MSALGGDDNAPHPGEQNIHRSRHNSYLRIPFFAQSVDVGNEIRVPAPPGNQEIPGNLIIKFKDLEIPQNFKKCMENRKTS